MANFYEKIIGHARFHGEQTTYYVEITADTAADIPNPAEHPEWEVGSELVVLENGGSKYRLSNARNWVQVNFGDSEEGGDGQTAADTLYREINRTAAVSTATLGYEKKNFVQTTPVTFSKFGITATVNADGTITLNGTSSNSNSAYILLTNLRVGGTVTAQEHDNYPLLPPGEYLLTGSSTNDDARIQVRLASEPDSNGESSALSSAAGPVKFTVTEEQKYTYARLYISANASFDNETIYPMIRDARIADGAYAPYRPSVEERLSALEARIAELAETAS